MTGKTATSTSTVQVPPDVLARYDSVNAAAQNAASTPFQQYSSDPSAFVAPLTATQQAGIQNTNTAATQAQPYYSAATSNLLSAQGQALPLYGQATGDLLTAQSQASPYYGQASDALTSGANAGQYYYGQANGLVGSAYNGAQPYNGAATGLALAGSGAVNAGQIGENQINQFMNPYLGDVVNSTSALLNQNNQQAMAGQLGNAITSGAFGGDRAGVAAANLNQQQNLANANIYSGLLSQGYNTALGAAQQQQGVNLSAAQANRAALQYGAGELANIGQQQYAQGMGAAQQYASDAQGLYGIGSGLSSGLANIGTDVYNLGANTATGLANLGQGAYNIGAGTANSLASLGAGAQSAALQGSTAQLTAGQQEQSTQQAGLTSLYNQFLQQQAYPFQTSQFLANIAEGTGSLSGSTTSTTQPTGLFGNLLSDRRAKEDIREMGKAKNGLKIYSFRYKGDPEKVTHIGFMADEVEKKHPEAVGLAGGLKTVDYDRASRADGGSLMFDPNAGEYGLGASATPGHGTYVPAPTQSAARKIAFQSTPPSPWQSGQGTLDQYNELKGLYSAGKDIYGAGKSLYSGLGAATMARGGLALRRDNGGIIDDPFQSDYGLQQREKGLAAGENAIEQAPNSGTATPVSGALSSQASGPKYSLGATPQASNSNNSASSNIAELAGLATLAKDVGPYLARGGLVPREHHADGDSVGDNATLNSDEFGRPLVAEKPAEGLAAAEIPIPPKRSEDLGTAKLPGVSPDAVDEQPKLDASKLDGPAPFTVPDEIKRQYNAVPPAAPQPGLVPPADAAPVAPVPQHKSLPAPPVPAQTPDAKAPVAPGMEANVAPTYSGGLWAAPAYTGNRPTEAPDPSKYGVDRAGQAAFIRDYAAYKGIQPEFALGVGKAEGLNAISPNNPNGASSVDIDPSTGKPFSFGAFQLNVRNGLGTEALKQGIDPTNPAHANLANKFAIDNMATGGLKPWRGDAAVKAYQQGLVPAAAGPVAGQGGAAPTAAAQTQQGGLAASLGSFLHGNPDGQTSPNGGMGERALMAVLSGLGAIGSYRGMSPLGAALQGLGGGAQGWMQAGKTQADIGRTQADTGLVGAETARNNVNAARESVIPEYGYVLGPDGKLHVVDKSIGSTGVPLMGGVPTAAAKQTGIASGSPDAAPSGSPAPGAPKLALTGVGYDADSAQRAHNEVLAGPQARHDIDQSAEYQKKVRDDGQAAQTNARYARQLAGTLTQAYGQTGYNAVGAGAQRRSDNVNTLNTVARSAGLGDGFFGDSDTSQVLTNKINTLQSAMREHNAGQHSLGALEVFKGTNASLDQPPEASSEIAARAMTENQRSLDQMQHMEKWKSDTPTGTVLGAQSDFNAKNPMDKYDREADEIKNLMLTKRGFFTGLTSGQYSAPEIANALKKRGLDPSLTRYFVGAQ